MPWNFTDTRPVLKSCFMSHTYTHIHTNLQVELWVSLCFHLQRQRKKGKWLEFRCKLDKPGDSQSRLTTHTLKPYKNTQRLTIQEEKLLSKVGSRVMGNSCLCISTIPLIVHPSMSIESAHIWFHNIAAVRQKLLVSQEKAQEEELLAIFVTESPVFPVGKPHGPTAWVTTSFVGLFMFLNFKLKRLDSDFLRICAWRRMRQVATGIPFCQINNKRLVKYCLCRYICRFYQMLMDKVHSLSP